MATPPTRDEIAGTPTNAEAKAGFGKLWDYVTELLGTTGNKSDAVTALGLSPYTGFKNRIINSAMMIDQRNAGASVTASTTGSLVFTVDRWAYLASQASKFTVQQNAGSVTPPAGFTNYLGVTVGASANVTLGSTDYFAIDQPVEGYNLADLAYGTASASPVTLSFWVRSSLTGALSGSLRNWDASKSYPFSYTVNSANTWEQKTITISGDTATALGSTTNGKGLVVVFNLGCGSTSLSSAGTWQSGAYNGVTGSISPITTNSATFYITGVQLEKGSTATSFDYRPYVAEFDLCLRYAQAISGSFIGLANSATTGEIDVPLFSPMRSVPTMTNAGNGTMVDGTTAAAITNAALASGSAYGPQRVNITSSGMTQSRVINAVGQTLLFSSEP